MEFEKLMVLLISSLSNFIMCKGFAFEFGKMSKTFFNEMMDFWNHKSPRDSNVCEDLKTCYSHYDCGFNYELPYARCIKDPGCIILLDRWQEFYFIGTL